MNCLQFDSKTKRSLNRVLKPAFAILFTSVLLQNSALANVNVEMHQVTKSGQGQLLGTITLTENDHGVVFSPNLKGLTPGQHGFHVHQFASCEPKKKGDKVVPGGHFDPKASEHHDAPWANGHLGDLPALYVNESGQAKSPVLAPRLTLEKLKQHAVMIHEGSDNYADEPKPLGGGGSRVACGVIK
ncbi:MULTISPECIES: superoxide dismutase family protein [unclassified Pseudoalteromonas]|uniref:superoxide dismutase family protein n=1 Tax=unclassified Pseudoalteromonas TaxID=194690 RepID=UPI0003F5520D|nr:MULTISPECIES: superoxide dismutase family protein [unclassified Pseudoalteromonas]